MQVHVESISYDCAILFTVTPDLNSRHLGPGLRQSGTIISYGKGLLIGKILI